MLIAPGDVVRFNQTIVRTETSKVSTDVPSSVAGRVVSVHVQVGDALYAMDLADNLAYCVPKEGSNVWVDAFVIPKTAKNVEYAELFIDFMSRPEIAKLNCEEIWYSSPNVGAIELMVSPFKKLMRGPKRAWWIVGVVMLLFALFIWPAMGLGAT